MMVCTIFLGFYYQVLISTSGALKVLNKKNYSNTLSKHVEIERNKYKYGIAS